MYLESKYDWLAEEKRFIRSAVREGVRVLGICLGAQFLAETLGGRVFRNADKEIGWHPVRRTAERHPPLGRTAGEVPFVPLAQRRRLAAGGGRAARRVGCDRRPGVRLRQPGAGPAVPSGDDARLHGDDAGPLARRADRRAAYSERRADRRRGRAAESGRMLRLVLDRLESA
ncbi:gamma-glutamyl-gamma-aminobutyrate hydrolase family protein [Cohnella nanjingensis]|uniref:Gamma-glutamyl-gamma-aminobutyrate hydrolase family protein n=1 Tax=Cohnella nanjingensis TaxID=1387779 RepID=A0A7X0VIN7_9BACL|nr:gamma-glutamyl-gamma-aminobutyrate hydrolase family protein [Cohnella nanjingensis]